MSDIGDLVRIAITVAVSMTISAFIAFDKAEKRAIEAGVAIYQCDESTSECDFKYITELEESK